MDDLISRQAAIEALKNDMASLDHIIKGMSANDVRLDAYVSQRNQVNYDIYTINNLPPAQPEQLGTNLAEVGTDCISRQAAIDFIDAGHLVNPNEPRWSDNEVVNFLKSRPSAQPEINCSEFPNSSDTISRAKAIDALWKALYEYEDKTEKQFQESAELDVSDWIEHRIFVQNMSDIDRQTISALPSAQPERTCVNCGRTVNNGGWYADGGTRCPIEEHYALPKDGYCHLWEKRNVTDDDYLERRTDE